MRTKGSGGQLLLPCLFHICRVTLGLWELGKSGHLTQDLKKSEDGRGRTESAWEGLPAKGMTEASVHMQHCELAGRWMGLKGRSG